MTKTVLYQQDGHIARLTLNRPEKHNALGEVELTLIQQYVSITDENRDVRVLIVSGNGGSTFCAGASLEQMNSGQISGDFFQQTTDMLRASRVPTICAVNGNVFGGGVELALSCDFRVGIEDTRMRVPAAAIGLCYPLQGINRFVEKLGVNVAKRILIAAEELSADDMLSVGFLDHLVMPAQLEQIVERLAGSIAGLAPMAVQSMKVILKQVAAGNVDEKQAQELAEGCRQSDDLKEGYAAQREKRKPVFKGD